MRDKFEFTVLDMIESAARSFKTTPLNLGGLSGAGGGIGTPPGGYIGQLPQTRVAYDETEAATLDTPASGMSIVDNLNHIRYRLGVVESGSVPGTITIIDDNEMLTYDDVTIIHFSGGVSIVELNPGEVQVIVTASGGSGTPLTVEDYDGNPSITNVDKIVFSGAMLTDLGDGDVLVQVSSAESEILCAGTPFYFTSLLSSLVEGSDAMREIQPTYFNGGGSHDLTVGSLPSGDTKLVYVFITPEYWPQIDHIPAGIIKGFIQAKQDSGTREMTARLQIYKQNTAGTQTLLATTDSTPALTGSFVDYELTATISTPVVLDLSDRLVVKVYYNGSVSGTNAAITFRIRTNAVKQRVEFPFPEPRLAKLNDSGWIPVSDDWTRTGNYTFLVAGDQSTIYRKGTKIRYKDGGSYEYGVVGSVSVATNTTVTLISTSDFAMAAATITDKYISYVENPQGFPETFNFTPTGLVTIGNGTQTARWKAQGTRITLEGHITYGSTTTFGSSDLTLPVAVDSFYPTGGSRFPLGICIFLDAAVAVYFGNAVYLSSGPAARIQVQPAGGTYVTTSVITSTVPMTWGTGDELSFNIEYDF